MNINTCKSTGAFCLLTITLLLLVVSNGGYSLELFDLSLEELTQIRVDDIPMNKRTAVSNNQCAMDSFTSAATSLPQETPMNPITHGVHHIGLTVKNLDIVKDFFIDVLGFRESGGKPDYPAVFITDGVVTITLWEVRKKNLLNPFDHRQNIGLHHLALMVAPESLEPTIQKIAETPGVVIEFYPEPLGDGRTRHSVFYAPGGIRLELIAPESE